jgi:hypothetical protein
MSFTDTAMSAALNQQHNILSKADQVCQGLSHSYHDDTLRANDALIIAQSIANAHTASFSKQSMMTCFVYV